MPGIFPFLSQYVFPAIIFVVMFGMGLALSPGDFRAVVTRPRAVFLGLACQLVMLPLIGLALASFLPISPEVAVGLMILATSPGGVTSNAITLSVGADVALAVALTAISTLLVAFTLPLWTSFALSHFLGATEGVVMPVDRSMVTLAMLTVLPVCLGMLAKAFLTKLAARGVLVARKLAVWAIVFLAVTTTVFNVQFLASWSLFLESLALCVALMFAAMAGAYGLSRAARLGDLQVITIVIEVGVHNLAIALLVSVSMVGLPSVARLPLVYGLLMVSVPWLFVRWERARQARVARGQS